MLLLTSPVPFAELLPQIQRYAGARLYSSPHPSKFDLGIVTSLFRSPVLILVMSSAPVYPLSMHTDKHLLAIGLRNFVSLHKCIVMTTTVVIHKVRGATARQNPTLSIYSAMPDVYVHSSPFKLRSCYCRVIPLLPLGPSSVHNRSFVGPSSVHHLYEATDV